MGFEYIQPDDLRKTFEDAKRFMMPLHEPFDEFERISRNKPHPGIAKNLPRVTDGTLAAIVQETPKRVIQQIPTGRIETRNNKWLEIVADFILEQEILPNSEEEAALIQKCWSMVSKVLTYGSQPAYVQFVRRGDYFGTDFSLPYIKDVLLEPGKISDRASNVIFLRTWWSKNQLQYIIYKEKELGKRAASRREEYKSGWDLERLATLIEDGPSQKDVNAQTPSEKGKQLNSGFFEIVHAFQRGIGANFYSFSPQLEDGENVLRSRVNPDPRGFIPIHFMYANLDFSNPLGRGSIEMSGGMQNLLDSEVQMYQYMRAMGLNPAMKKKGSWDSTNIKLEPLAIIDLGNEQNADLVPFEIDTKAVETFPQNYGLIKSQILNLNNSNDTSVSADVGNPGFSKTHAGVEAMNLKLGISDNYIRKQFETCWGDIMETEVNLYFAERKGIQELIVDDETAAKLREIQPDAVSKDNKIRIDYDTETPNLKFTVDPSSSNVKDNADQLEKASNVLDMTQKYPQLDSKQGGPINVTELADRIVGMIGLEGAEKIVVNTGGDQVDENGQPVQGGAGQQPQVTPEMVQQIVDQAIAAKADRPKQLSESLALKLTDFSADVRLKIQEEVLKQLGIDYVPQQPDQITLDHTIKASDSAAKVADLQHKGDVAAANAATAATDSQIKASDAAVKVAQLKHNENVAATQADQHAATLADTQQARKDAAITAEKTAKAAAKQPKPVKAGVK